MSVDSYSSETPLDPAVPLLDLDGTDSFAGHVPVGAKIAVIGVGGAGCNAVNRMIDEKLPGVHFFAVNTDKQALAASKSSNKLQIGERSTRGLGAGGRPEVGRQAIEESISEVVRRVEGYDLVFVTAGMGGGTGTGAAPIIARAVREKGILTIAIVSLPFHFEGRKRMRFAEEGRGEITAFADTVIVVPNERLMEVLDRDISFPEALKRADDVLLNATRGISGIIVGYGEINTDFADVRTIMSDGGHAILGLGTAAGEGRALRAAEMAVKSPLLDNVSLAGAKRLLVNIRGSRKIRTHEVNEAVTLVRKSAHPDAEVIFGIEFIETEEDEMSVTVVATGFEPEDVVTPVDDTWVRPESTEQSNASSAEPQVDWVPSAEPVSRPQIEEEAAKEGSSKWFSRLLKRDRPTPPPAPASTPAPAPKKEVDSPAPGQLKRPTGLPPSFLRPD